MNSLLFILFAGICLAAPLDKREISYENMLEAYTALPPEKQETYQLYFSPESQIMSREQKIKMFAHMKTKDPDLYEIARLAYGQIIKTYKGSDEGRKFLEYFYAQLDAIPDESQLVYDAFVSNVQKELDKFNGKEKEELIKSLPGYLIEKLTDIQKAFLQLSADDQKIYVDYLKNITWTSDAQTIQMLTELHKNEPGVFANWQTIVKKVINGFDGNQQAKGFLLFFYLTRLEQISDITYEEFEKFVKDVNQRWKQLDDEAKTQLTAKYGFFSGIIKSA